GKGDDQALYLYVPVIAHLSGNDDPDLVLRRLVLAMSLPAIAIAPLIFFLIFKSLASGIVAPILTLIQLDYIGVSDVYWAPAWALLLALPLVWMSFRRWTRWTLWIFAGLALIAGMASSFRAQAGLPILLGLAIALLVSPTNWRVRSLFAVVMIASYLTTESLIVESVRAMRDSTVHQPLAAEFRTSHIFWHNAYIGLGFIPNEYGLKWDDSVASNAVERVDPGAVLGTPRYEDDVRALYLDLLRRDPWFVLRGYVVKIAVLL